MSLAIDKNAPVDGLPNYDAAADRGTDFTPTAEDSAPVELTEVELTAIGKPPVVEQPGDKTAKPDAKDANSDTKGGEQVLDKDGKPVVKEDAKDTKSDAKEEQPRDKEGKFIPKARFDEVNQKAKARVAAAELQTKQLQDRLNALFGGKAPDMAKLETELATKSKEYTALVADGKIDDATVIMADINRINRTIGNIEATLIADEQGRETTHVATLGELVDLYKENYPVFDEANKELYNQEMVDYVARLQGGFEASGSSPAEALREAVEAAVAKFHLDPEPAAAVVVDEKPNKGAERKAEAVKTAVKAAAAQPNSLDKVGEDSDKAGMSKVSLEQIADMETFQALAKNPGTLQRLRGDFVS